ncbi:RfbA dTDP-glucose pyrophosphorylase [Candidatus Nanopelagicaceae bacterium]
MEDWYYHGGMKGIVLAGGTGSRLWPVTYAVSKQLLPIYDKPLIYYPLGTLMELGIREIALVTTKTDQHMFKSLLGDGKQFGIDLQYFTQDEPNGIAQVFLITNEFIQGHNSTLILGDNLFHGIDFASGALDLNLGKGAKVVTYEVEDPSRYGVLELNTSGSPIRIVEKPKNTNSNLAVTGLYVYDSTVVERARTLKPSKRGELEITDLNNSYLASGQLDVFKLKPGTAWIDTGTFDSLIDAANYIRILEERQGKKVSCLEEIAWRNKWISSDLVTEKILKYKGNSYSKYLQRMLEMGADN